MNLLVIKSSILGDSGQSNFLAEQFLDKWRADHPQTQVVERNVATHPIPHLDGERMGALTSEPEQRTPKQQAVVDFADELLSEVNNADAIVLGVPMYNFSIPSQLKAWFDHLDRAGVSFKYTENGPVGLLEDKPVYILAARGGIYHANGHDHQTPFIRQLFNLIGITKLEFIYAEGLNLGEESKTDSLKKAEKQIHQLIETYSSN